MPNVEPLERQMVVNRAFEERVQQLFKEGVLGGTIHLSIGQEAVDVGVVSACPDAMFFGTHRSHGQYLAATGDIEGLLDQIRAGMTQHLHKKDKFISHGIQGALASVACGYTFAQWYNRPAVCFIGDGTLGEGNLYESFNLASVFDLPVSFVVIDNGYSMSKTPKRRESIQVMCRNLAKTFGFRWLDMGAPITVDVESVYLSSVKHFDFLQGEPSLVFSDVKRLCGHSCNDTEMYRPKEERDPQWREQHDPLTQIRLTKEDQQHIRDEVNDRITKHLSR